jgi:hypothetical protein
MRDVWLWSHGDRRRQLVAIPGVQLDQRRDALLRDDGFVAVDRGRPRCPRAGLPKVLHLHSWSEPGGKKDECASGDTRWRVLMRRFLGRETSTGTGSSIRAAMRGDHKPLTLNILQSRIPSGVTDAAPAGFGSSEREMKVGTPES